ncbi:MAG: ABC transporter permease [Bacteroidia bacterium]|nr:ABC transporter permease [Bacteroidia bacterium]MBT8229556.1 ABC transporter permease [Bacteroidia bacterium]
MIKVLKYSLADMIRNRWMIIYFLFFLVLTLALLFLSSDIPKLIITLTNVILTLTPLIGLLFGVMYYYNSLDFIRLLLAQPLSRKTIFLGLYGGLALSLCLSLFAGVFIPLLFYGILASPELWTVLILIGMACVLTIIFSLLAFIIAMKSDNRIRGFGLSMFTWLFFAIIYDGIFLLLLSIFKDYPLENLTIILTSLNPVDLARILILLKLDISAMMGYTGAVLQKFLGSSLGYFFILTILTVWTIIPLSYMTRLSGKKDF